MGNGCRCAENCTANGHILSCSTDPHGPARSYGPAGADTIQTTSVKVVAFMGMRWLNRLKRPAGIPVAKAD